MEESPQKWSLISIRFFPFCLLYDKDFLLNLWGSTVELTPVLIKLEIGSGLLLVYKMYLKAVAGGFPTSSIPSFHIGGC